MFVCFKWINKKKISHNYHGTLNLKHGSLAIMQNMALQNPLIKIFQAQQQNSMQIIFFYRPDNNLCVYMEVFSVDLQP